ncbi:ATP-dependent RNA helicase dbp4 [Bacidia gigantensis]|uniref:ATP-dependent RNA helicase dbp4 n=1 Tax=Bacidia gigantensis TaxID=2732470 RepID=UPI001D045A87|nr:ATP-dependent RNA helicase dbp4 [Bacidia gigantensis]KAG8527638.1 ATP-dependent RNA helicase dbp4 [Bacidia gigantensis]
MPVSTTPHPKSLKRKRAEDLGALDKRVNEIDLKEDLDAFAQLPLSQPTAAGLDSSHFKILTEIQRQAIPRGLQGFDILGAAKTGSGKTLAFLVPVLEILYRKAWTEHDGLGALILSPTRELAIQIFEVLRKIGRYHTFSAGLVIGGKSLQEERERLGRMNILVCTPGRILQHMDQTSTFEIDNLQTLVLDEADRIMDMGFQSTVDAIVEHLPKKRQTLLYSATQTKKVSDLARLSLKDPEYISVHETAGSATPSTLQQNYIVTPLPEKLDTLWSFLRSNLKSKILVFFSSGKQVRFVYESFRHMQPGISLMHLHGRQKQGARLDITSKFATSKYSCLFATDVIARGLDFPAVDWVIQLDCPEDADTYIHRVGRTARYERDGKAVLFLEPTEEEGMIKRLEQKKVTLEKIHVRQKKQQSIQSQLQNMCFKDPELKYLGQKAFISYVRSVHIQKDKDVFKLNDLPLEKFSDSLGLPGAPRIKFGKGDTMKALKNAPRGVAPSSASEADEPDSQPKETNNAREKGTRTKYDRMFERKNQDILTDHYSKLISHKAPQQSASSANDSSDEEELGFMKVKRRLSNTAVSASTSDDHTRITAPTRRDAPAHTTSGIGKNNISARATNGLLTDQALVIDSKRREKLLKSKKKLLKYQEKGKKLVYDSDGNAHEIYELEDEEKFRAQGLADAQKAGFVSREKERLKAADLVDKESVKAKRRERREKKRAKMREGGDGGEEEEGYGGGVQLVPFEEGDGDFGGLSDVEETDEICQAKKKRERQRKANFEDGEDGLEGSERLEDLEAVVSGLLNE